MMKNILIILFVFLQFSTYAQNDSNWNIGVEFSKDDLTNTDYIITDIDQKSLIVFDKNNYNCSLGLIAKYLVQERLGLSIGILHSNKDGSFTSNYEAYSWAPGPIKQRFMTVPISINYSLLPSKLNPILNDGIKNNLEIISDLKEKSDEQLLTSTITKPFWYRGYYKDDDLTQEQVDQGLIKFNAKAVIVWHTIQSKVNRSFNGKVIGIDVQHPNDFPKNWPIRKSEAFLIENGKYYRVLASSKKEEI